MTEQVFNHLALLLELSITLMTGIYFIFSNTVMHTLKKVDNGAQVMIEINRVIVNSGFLSLFFLSGFASIFFMVFGEGIERLAGVIFFVGNVLVTVVKNVPLNKRLQALEADGERLLKLWQHYLKDWVFWNHVRTLSAVIAGALLIA